jgi:hypothetical protein
MSRTLRTTCVTTVAALALLVLAVPAAQAAPRFFFSIGVPVPVAPVVVAPPVVPPRPVVYGSVWRPGYYNWTGYSYAWVPGVWVRPPYARAVWVGPRWVRRPGGFFWARGYWRR